MKFKCRANNSVNKKLYLEVVNEMIEKKHFVDPINPQLTLLVEICQDLLCFTIIDNYEEYMKYNLQKLTKSFIAEDNKEIKPKDIPKETNYPTAKPKEEIVEKKEERNKEESDEDIKLI